MGFGREYPTTTGAVLHDGAGAEAFAARQCGFSLHGEVSRAMWKCLYPGKPEDAVPIGHITNGVHVPSWLAPQMCRFTIAISASAGRATAARRAPGKRLRTWTTASFGRRT
jgi:glucan phosphorylase